MQRKKRIFGIAAGVVIALSSGGAATAFGLSNEVDIDNNGEITKVRTFDKNVDEILDKQGIQIEKAEKVTPALNQEISTNDNKIIIEQLATVNITIDGSYENVTLHTDAANIEQVLAENGYEITKQKVSPSMDTELVPGKTTHITIDTPYSVTFKGMYGEYTAEDVFHKTIGEVADEYLSNYDPERDTLTPGRETLLTSDTTVEIVRTRNDERVETESIPFKKTTVESEDLFEGEEKVTTKGVNGVLTKTIKDTKVDKKVTKSEVIKEEVTKKPVNEVTTKGTKKKPAPVVEEVEPKKVETESSSDATSAPKSSSSNSSSEKKAEESSSKPSSNKSESNESSSSSSKVEARSSGNGSGLLSGIPQWKIDRFDQLAQCESGGNWSINTGNSFTGGIQFTRSSWLAAGGGKYAPEAYLATREEQIATGVQLQSMQGWGAWPSCSSKYGYI